MEVWIGLGALTFVNIIGWIISQSRYSHNEAKYTGELSGMIKGLDARMQSIEERMGNMESRLDGLLH